MELGPVPLPWRWATSTAKRRVSSSTTSARWSDSAGFERSATFALRKCALVLGGVPQGFPEPLAWRHDHDESDPSDGRQEFSDRVAQRVDPLAPARRDQVGVGLPVHPNQRHDRGDRGDDAGWRRRWGCPRRRAVPLCVQSESEATAKFGRERAPSRRFPRGLSDDAARMTESLDARHIRAEKRLSADGWPVVRRQSLTAYRRVASGRCA